MGVIMKNKVNYTGGGGSGGASALADLEDVELTTPTDGQALVYDAENDLWVNGNVSGGTLVIQNASIYSEEEQQIGVWIDGKPLYQKSFIFSNISTLTGNQSYQTDLSNVDEAFLEGEIIEGVNRYAIPWAGNSGYALGFFFNTSTNYIWTKGTDTFSNATLKITVKYTKTTDAAGSGGYKAYGLSPIIYSEEEREVGVWTDGKPLYQKTIPVTASTSANYVDIQHGVANIDRVIKSEGYIYYTGSQGGIERRFMPQLYYTSMGDMAVSVYTVSDTALRVIYGSWLKGLNQSTVEINVTIYYTKTTDTAGSGIWTTTGEYAHHYSTDEKVIGTWIDGRPLYEKTYQREIAGNTTIDIDTGIDFCLVMGVSYTQSGNITETLSPQYIDASTRVYCYVQAYNTNNTWTLLMRNNHSSKLTWTAVVRYTKVADLVS